MPVRAQQPQQKSPGRDIASDQDLLNRYLSWLTVTYALSCPTAVAAAAAPTATVAGLLNERFEAGEAENLHGRVS